MRSNRPVHFVWGLPLCLLAVLAAATACGSTDTERSGDVVAGLDVADGVTVSTWADGFDRPTQMTFAPNGDLVIAELSGGENDGTGRILRVDATDLDERVVLHEGLDKPTGIAITGDRLWIMERNRLSVTSLSPNANRDIVAQDLPSNGRSEGTLTVTPDGQLLYNTSGSKRGPDRVDGSGMLFAIANAANGPQAPTVIASGFKHAYAHVIDGDGQLWSVEMTDGNFDGERASDELVAIQPGDDAGWPQCVDDNRPVVEYGGTADLCSASPRSHALFGPGATPTSVVIAPWDADLFIVALWLPGQVVTVARTPAVGAPHVPELLVDGIESPQHLLVDGDGVLVSDHETGQIFRITAD